jgi:WD40 repeat protein
LTGHTGQIEALASNRADSLFAIGSNDKAVGLWSARGSAAGQRLGLLEHHDKAIYALAFGGPADATDMLLAGSGFPNIYVWDIATQQVRYVLTGHLIYCESLTFSPDGALLASGGSDHQVCVWDMATGQLRHTLQGHRGSIWGLAFSPDGRLLVSGSGDHQVCVWDVEHGTLIRTLQGHAAWLGAVAFNQDGTLLATGSADGAVKLWDVNGLFETGICLDTLYAKGPYAGMNITGVTGISEAQKQALKALGALEEDPVV